MVTKKKISVFSVVLNLFFVLVSLCFILPMLMTIAASFSDESKLLANGFGILPRGFTPQAYRSAFANVGRMVQAYVVTIAQAAIGTALSCVIAGMAGYSLSRSNFRFRKVVTGYIFFTMLFSAGMIPTYIVFSRYYHINNTFWVYILPGITGGAWNTMVFRTFFKGLSESLFESAYLDGATELKIYSRIVIPLSKPVYASLGFMTLVGKWNDYTTSMIYIRDENLYTLQYLLQRLMNETEFLKQLIAKGAANLAADASATSSETLKYALCVVAAGPMLVAFPFFQKYFSRGIMIGAVKG